MYKAAIRRSQPFKWLEVFLGLVLEGVDDVRSGVHTQRRVILLRHEHAHTLSLCASPYSHKPRPSLRLFLAPLLLTGWPGRGQGLVSGGRNCNYAINNDCLFNQTQSWFWWFLVATKPTFVEHETLQHAEGAWLGLSIVVEVTVDVTTLRLRGCDVRWGGGSWIVGIGCGSRWIGRRRKTERTWHWGWHLGFWRWPRWRHTQLMTLNLHIGPIAF